MARRSGRDDFFERIAPNCSSGIIAMMVGTIAAFAGYRQDSATAFAYGITLIIAPLAMVIYLRRIGRGLLLRPTIPERVFEGDPLEIRVDLEGRAPPRGFDLRLSERPGVSRAFVRTLTFGEYRVATESRSQRYSFRCEATRGEYEAGESWMRLGDPFGWFEFRCQLHADRKVLVLPRIFDLPLPLQRSLGLARSGQDAIAARPGHSHELRGLRPYRSGDPRSRIHWKQSARTGQLVIREDEAEHEGGLVLALDGDLADDARGVGTATLDRAARLMASLVVAMHRLGLPLRVVLAPTRDATIEIGGDDEVQEFLDALARLRLAQDETLPQLLDQIVAAALHPTEIMVLSRARNLRSLACEAAIARLVAAGHRANLVLVGDGDLEARVVPPRGVRITAVPTEILRVQVS